jgi:hypothetical protein
VGNPIDLILHTLLDRTDPALREKLERFLPSEQRERLRTLPICAVEDHEVALIDQIHWSWLVPTLKSYSRNDQQWFLSVLPSALAIALRRSLQIPIEERTPSEAGRAFLRRVLTQSLVASNPHRIPASWLPDSPLKQLIHCSKQQLIRLVDLLPLYDLALEIRHIVEARVMKKIYAALTKDQQTFLKQVLAHHDLTTTGRFSLERWDGTADGLHLLLHRRGLTALAIALSAQNPGLAWHIAHQFDIGRGHLLLKLIEEHTTSSYAEILTNRITEILAQMS